MSEDKEQSPLPGAGPELDRLVAAKMGFEWEPFESGSGPSGEWVIPGTNRTAYDVRWIHRTGLFQPQYSTNISAAWEIIHYIQNNISRYVWVDSYKHKWIVQIRDADKGQEILATGRSTDAAHAICLAFLQAKDVV